MLLVKEAKMWCHPFTSVEVLIVPSCYQFSTLNLVFKTFFISYAVLSDPSKLPVIPQINLNLNFLLTEGVCLYFSPYHDIHRK